MYNPFDKAYHSLCEEVLEIGNQRDDRTHTIITLITYF